MIEGKNLSEWGSRRPLSDSYLAGHLYFAREQVTLALTLAGIFSAAAIGFAAAEVRRYMGLLAATLWTWLLLVYYRRYLGEMLSEHAGVAFGALSAALLIRAFSANSFHCLWLGLFTLSLALNARAGALIVLPALLAAVTWHWRQSGRVRVMFLATISVAAGFMMSFSFLKLVGAPGGRLMSNYHDHMYGIVFGGNWQQAAADIPNYYQMNESARAAEIDRRIVAALKAKPLLLWYGAKRNWSDFFTRSKAALGPFSFFMHPSTEYWILVLSGGGLLCAIGISHRLSILILATGLGVVLSVPFVPTPDADRMRAYAATMPLMFLIPAYSFVGLRAWKERLAPKIFTSSRPSPQIVDNPNDKASGLVYCAFTFLVTMLLVPLFARFVAPVSPAVTLKESGQEVELMLDLRRATWVELSASSDLSGRRPQQVSTERFDRGIFGSFHYFYPKQASFLECVSRPGIALVCPGSTETAFLVIDAKHLSQQGPKVIIVGHEYSADSNYDPSFLEKSISLQAIARKSLP